MFYVKKNIELDISHRRTGKTTRLLQRMEYFFRYADQHARAYLVVPISQHIQHIERAIMDTGILPTDLYTRRVTVKSSKSFIPQHLQRADMVFFDEFDQCPEALPFIENSYYSGTLTNSYHSQRHQDLVDLLLKHSFVIHRHHIS